MAPRFSAWMRGALWKIPPSTNHCLQSETYQAPACIDKASQNSISSYLRVCTGQTRGAMAPLAMHPSTISS